MFEWLIRDLRNTLKHLQNYAKVSDADSACFIDFGPTGYPNTNLSSKYLIFAGWLLVLPPAYGAEPQSCQTSMQRLSVDSPLSTFSADNFDPSFRSSQTIQLEAGGLEAQFGAEPTALMTGGVLLRQGDKLAGADVARYDPDNKALLLEGSVRYEDLGTLIASDSAEFGYVTGRIRFEGAEFSLGNNARGEAAVFEVNQDGRLELDGVSYTTCPPDSNDWLLEAKEIELDSSTGVGTARGVKVRFQGVPILYAPYLSFPLNDTRKSGVLVPEVSGTGRSGTEIRVPYYWNIAPNYDATIAPRLLTKRGLQLQTEFRYLTGNMNGIVDAEFMANDEQTDESRFMFNLDHQTLLKRGWRNLVDIQHVSDNQYFEDLGGSLSYSSITHLDRHVSFDYHTSTLSLFGQVQDYQTLDDAVMAQDKPYRRLPQLLVSGSWPNQLLGLRYGFNGELVNFDRDVGVTGWRLNAAPRIDLPIARPGWFITPAVELDYTSYQLSNTLPGESDDPDRTVPISSIDMGLVLERDMKSSRSERIQTIEPRLLYVHIPYRDQDDLPVFDTIIPNLNLVQLYRKNRFLGVDRISDTDQLSLGITTRILDMSSGKEIMSATIGQIQYLSARGVTLPGDPAPTDESSDYIAQFSFLLKQSWNFDLGHQWSTNNTGVARSEARFQYRPSTNKILNLAYRFRRDSLEQADISMSWPIRSNWNVVGRYNYSLRDDEVLEQFVGLEYESCCWGFRLVAREYISTRDGTRDSSIGLQFVLKGMSSAGTAADKLLERGILGYSAHQW